MKLLITSDWHLDTVTSGISRFPELDKAVQKTVAAALEAQVDRYIFLGDLCDPDTMRSHRSTAYVIAIERLLRENGIESWWLTGNHDVIEDGSGVHTLSPLKATGAKVFDEPRVEATSEAAFLILPFTARSQSYNPESYVEPLKGRPHKMVVLGHLNIEGIGPGSETKDFPRGRDVFLPLKAIRERWPHAHVFNGHYHEQQVFDGVYIPGSLARLTFGEEKTTPGFLIAEV